MIRTKRCSCLINNLNWVVFRNLKHTRWTTLTATRKVHACTRPPSTSRRQCGFSTKPTPSPRSSNTRKSKSPFLQLDSLFWKVYFSSFGHFGGQIIANRLNCNFETLLGDSSFLKISTGMPRKNSSRERRPSSLGLTLPEKCDRTSWWSSRLRISWTRLSWHTTTSEVRTRRCARKLTRRVTSNVCSLRCAQATSARSNR